MIEHTNGPWVIESKRDECFFIKTEDDKHVAFVGTARCVEDTGPLMKDNAIAISLLPELVMLYNTFSCIDFDRFTEHDEALLEDCEKTSKRIEEKLSQLKNKKEK